MSEHGSIYTHTARWIAQLSGRPLTFLLAVGLIVVWLLTGPLFGYSDTWQLVINTGTTIITFLMVFLIQNTQNRDGAAMQAKLDELLHAVKAADERFIGIEHLTDRDLDKILADVEARAQRLHGHDQRPIVATRAEDLSTAADKAAGELAAKKAPRRRKASA